MCIFYTFALGVAVKIYSRVRSIIPFYEFVQKVVLLRCLSLKLSFSLDPSCHEFDRWTCRIQKLL